MKMEVATMTSKGQITIPVAVRKQLKLEQGDKVVFIEDDHPSGGVRILNAAALTFNQGGELWPIKGKSYGPVTQKDLRPQTVDV